MEPSNRSTGLLAIAGGGARGVMPGAYLDFIHKEFKVDPKKLFHYHSGTSVGSIVALGLAKKGEQTVSDINKCLLETLPKVFSSPSIFSKIIHLGYAFQEEYGAAPLQAALNAQFGDALYNETTKPVLIMATKTNPVSPYRFISDQKSPYPNLTMTQVLRCSSAAPTYLPGFFLTNEKGGQDEFIDGGMSGANDPTNVAITYFSRRIPLNKKVVVLSLQTGECPLALPKSSSRWGWLTWVGSHNEALITSLFDTMITNTAEIVEDWKEGPSLAGRASLVLNPIIPLKDDALNSSSREILDALIDIANTDADANKDKIEAIVRELKP